MNEFSFIKPLPLTNGFCFTRLDEKKNLFASVIYKIFCVSFLFSSDIEMCLSGDTSSEDKCIRWKILEKSWIAVKLQSLQESTNEFHFIRG